MAGRTAIVGGGISGLALAYALRQQRQEVVLFEASSRVGGTIGSHERDGFWTETGPNTFLDREPAMGKLLSSLRLLPKVRVASPAAKKRFLFVGEKLHPLSPAALFDSELLSAAGWLRMLGDIFSRRSKSVDESLAEFGERHFGKAATAVLLDAFQVGIFAGDITQLSATSAFPQLKQMERKHGSLIVAMMRRPKKKKDEDRTPGMGASGAMASFEGGLGQLIVSLERSLESVIHRSAPVDSIARADGRWNLGFRSKTPESFERVVLAVPAFIAAELLRPLSSALAEELAAISYASVGVVHLGYDEKDLAERPEGLGFLVPSREERPTLGVLFISSSFPWRAPPGRVLLTCLMGGARNPEIAKLDDERLDQLARSELKRTLGIDADPCFRDIVKWPRGIPQYNVGHEARLRRVDESLRNLPGLFLTGNAYRGVGINDCVRNAFKLAEALRTP